MTRLHQTYLMITDLDTSIEFYTDVFGLTVAEQSDSKVVFKNAATELVLEEEFDEATLAEFGLAPPGPDRGSGVIIVLDVDDVDTVYERAKSQNASILTAPREVNWGRKLCLIEDPDGYVFEISHPR